MPLSERQPPSRRRKTPTTTGTTTTLKPPRTAPRSPAPRRRRRRRQAQLHTDPTSGDEDPTRRTTHIGHHPSVTTGGVGRARGVLDFALGGGGSGSGSGGGAGVRRSTATSRGGGGGGGSAVAADEEGLGLLRQQLSAVQRIRVEHERKDATIAALRLEVSNLSREREEMLALNRERNGEWLRLVRMEEKCRRLEDRDRDTARRWTREEDAWKKQLAQAQEQYLAERDRTEFRLGSMTERLNSELEGERTKSRDLEEKLRTLQEDLAAAKDKSELLIPRVKALEETNETLCGELAAAAGRCSEAELELSQLQAYRPLVERADSIDRRRAEAEEGLRVAAVEVGRERESSAAAKQEAVQLRSRLAEAEEEVRAQGSKALSLERDLLSATGRLEAAEAGARGSRVAAAALDELAELVFEALPPPSLSPLPVAGAAEGERAGISAGRGVGGGGGGREATLAGLAGLEARLARVSNGGGDGGNEGKGCEAQAEGGGGGRDAAGWCFDGRGELRRAVRAVRALAEAAAKTAVDRDRATSEAVHTQAELRSVLGRLEASEKEVGRLGRAVEDASAARSTLLPRLRDTQVSREAAEVVASRASSELAEVRGFLADMAGILARSTEAASADGDKSPWSNITASNSNFSTSGSPAATAAGVASTSTVTDARLISAVSAGVKGLLAERAVAAGALRDLEERCSRRKREVEEMSLAKRDGDAAHREQLVELRGWCESEVQAQRRAKKAAQAAADCALRDLSTAKKRVSAFEKQKSRISERVSAANVRVSSLAEEAAAARDGVRLLVRACVPLIDRCRVLAAQKRLLTKWHGPQPASGGRGFAGEVGGAVAMLAPGSAGGGVARATAAGLLLDGLRSLADALGREARGQRERPTGGVVVSNGEDGEASMPLRSTARDGGGDGRKTAGNGDCLGRHQARGQQQQQQQQWGRQVDEQPPLVSLRVVGIAAVAAQRLVRLAACRAARRASARAAAARTAARTAVAAATPAGDTPRTKESATLPPCSTPGHRTPPPTPPPTRDRDHDGGGGGGGFIPLGPWTSAGRGGVALLDEDELVPPPSVSLALSSVFRAGVGASCPNETAGAPDAAAADADLDIADASLGCGGSGGRPRDDGEPAAARCLELLGALVRNPAVEGRGRAGAGWGSARGGGGGRIRLDLGDAAGPSLLQVVAGGQAGHRSRLEKRGLVPPPPPWIGGGGRDPLAGGGGGGSRVIAGRCARHHGREAWNAWRARAEDEEALSLLEATRRGTAALARLAGEAETQLLESEAGRLRAKDEVAALSASKTALRLALDQKSELVSFLEEKVRMMEGEAAGTVPAAALAGTEKALTESLAEVETLRVRSESLYAELADAAARRKREARQARKGAQAASKEKAARAQLQEELLSLRSYVLRSEQTVQELQEEARRQARETGDRRCASTSRSTHGPLLPVADDDDDRLTSYKYN